MKKIIAYLFFIVTSVVYAQNTGISYQAVIYNPSTEILPGNNNPNLVLANKEICLRFSIKDAASSIEYQEVQKVITDEFGMVNLVVGQGNKVGGYAANFSAIVWNSSNKTLAVAIDTNANCSNFIEVSEQFFSAVPFAYTSRVAETVSGIIPIVNGGTGAATVAGAKTNLGLNHVDNTSDLNKPISTATQTALDAKAPLASPGFTGVPTAPTAAAGTNTTQIATTAFVNAALATAAAPDATTTLKGRIQLAGDLSGTAEAPTVPGLAIKENSANKSTNISLGNSDILFPTQKAVKTYVDNQVSSGVVDATTSVKGKLKLAGDLGGTADLPTVPGLANKENTIATGTTSQYWRGDKTWQTLDKSVIGLGNVDNTSDANKPVSTAVQTALNGKEDSVNKSTTTTLGTSDVLFPTQKAVKTYVDTQISANVSPDATSTVKGKIQLAGDLAGANSSAINPVISDNAISTNKITNSAVTTLKLADNAITNAKIGEVIRLENGGTGSNMANTSGYVKQATVGANLSTVSTIPVTDVTGAVRSVNGVVPASDGNVAVIIGRVFTGATVDPNLATSIINASPAKQQSDIYIVASTGNPNNGRTFIFDGTVWLEVATDLSTTDARYVNVDGDTIGGNLTVPTGKKIVLTDAPTGSTDAANKAYVDNLINSSATPDATTSIKGKIKLAGDLGGTADVPTVPALADKLGGSGTINFVPKFSSSKILSNSSIFDNGTNVGIGTSSPAAIFQIEGATLGSSGVSGTGSLVWLKQNSTWDANAPYALWVDGYSYLNGLRISGTDGQRAIYNQIANTELGFGSNGGDISFSYNNGLTRAIVIKSTTGNIGVGTTTPISLLSNAPSGTNFVSSNSAIQSSSGISWLTNTTGYNTSLYNASNFIGSNGLQVKVANNSNQTIALEVGQNTTQTGIATPLFNVLGNGYVGVGTNAPVSSLSNTTTAIQGSNTTNAFNGGLTWSSPGTGFVGSFYSQPANGNGLQIKIAGNTSSNNALEVSSGATQTGSLTPLFNVLGNGNVGVGTNAPLTRLIVNDNTYIANIPTTTTNLMDNSTFRPLTRFQATSGINNNAISHYLTTTTAATQAHNYSNGLTLPYVLQPAGGNVGIGTATPTAQLHTTGSVRFAGTGTPANGRVLTSDASGNATWQPVNFATAVTNRTADFTLTAADSGSVIVVNSATTVTITVPSTLSAGFYCQIIQQGAGQVNVVGSGVSVTSALGTFSRTTGSSIGIMLTSSTAAFLSGDTAF